MTNETAQQPDPLPPGRVDIHSHMLPGIDDGCDTVAESLESVRRLIEVGYVGTICTPHIWPDYYPGNTIENIASWTAALQHLIDQEGLNYRLWPGAELRLFPSVVKWMQKHGVPTLGSSRYVLTDFWEQDWPKWADPTFDWLLEEGFIPILAHPERLAVDDTEFDRLDAATERGVLLQGNFQPMTGELGRIPDARVRRLLDEGRYTFMAMDMHRPHQLDSRLDGMQLVAEEYGQNQLDHFTIRQPRSLILDESNGQAD